MYKEGIGMDYREKFANLQILCRDHYTVAKGVLEALVSKHPSASATEMFCRLDKLSQMLGGETMTNQLSNEAVRALTKLFNMAASMAYYVCSYNDGWTAVLHENFSVESISSYAQEFSRDNPRYLVVALGANYEQFVCVVYKDGQKVAEHYAGQELDHIGMKPHMGDIKLFAELLRCTEEETYRALNADVENLPEAMSQVLGHRIDLRADDIDPADGLEYLEVSAEGIRSC